MELLGIVTSYGEPILQVDIIVLDNVSLKTGMPL